MGVPGLLPFVRTAAQETHVERFESLAIDASSWLHRGARASVSSFLRGQTSTAWMGYTMRMLRMLQRYGVRPVVVFDGAPLPMKARTDALRREQRKRHAAAAQALMAEGKIAEAEREAAMAIEVTSLMREGLIAELQQLGIAFVVAPYEADAQLVHLVQSGQVDAAVTEDSDLLAYQCPRTLFKLQDTGHATLINYDDLCFVTENGSYCFGGGEGWESWRQSRFTDMCILAGCDFVEMPGWYAAVEQACSLRAGGATQQRIV